MRYLLQILRALSILSLSLGVSGAPAPESDSKPALMKRAGFLGIDVSERLGTLTEIFVTSRGIQYGYIEATMGATHVDVKFRDNYAITANLNITRGAYHYALPNRTESDGVRQANHFLSNGGRWPGDEITLPGAVKLDGIDCFGLTAAQMVTWIHDFSNTYRLETSRFPVIYTTTSWWTSCTGNSAEFDSNPLWISHFGDTFGTLPASWNVTTFWQFAAPNSLFPVYEDSFDGDAAGLSRFALG